MHIFKDIIIDIWLYVPASASIAGRADVLLLPFLGYCWDLVGVGLGFLLEGGAVEGAEGGGGGELLAEEVVGFVVAWVGSVGGVGLVLSWFITGELFYCVGFTVFVLDFTEAVLEFGLAFLGFRGGVAEELH